MDVPDKNVFTQGYDVAFNPLPSTLIEVFGERVKQNSNKEAIIYVDDSKEFTITYAELEIQVKKIASYLTQISNPGDRALLIYPSGFDFIPIYLGVLYAGVIAIPIDPSSVQKKSNRLENILADSQASLILSTNNILNILESKVSLRLDLGNIQMIDSDLILATFEGDEIIRRDIFKDTIAMIQYTSGSTNEPKGVMLSHSNLVSNLNLIHYGFQLEENVVEVSWLPHFHDMGLIGGILGPIFCGGTAVLISPTTFLLKPNFWLSTISKYKASVSGAPNFAYDYCVEKISLLEAESLNLESWRIAFCGAEPIRYDTLDRFAKKFEVSGFKKESFYPCYGLAESTLLVSGNVGPISPVSITVDTNLLLENIVVLESDGKNNKTTKLLSSGKQLLNQKIIVVDIETLQQHPDLEIGEIWISSPSVGQGYWNRPEESKQVFEATLKSENDKSKYLRTGDLGFTLENELFVVGRLKDVIIIRGKNYFPNDIESIVGNSHKALRKGHCVAFSMGVGEKNEEKLFIAQELERRYHKLPDYHDIFLEIRKNVALNFDIQPYVILLLKPYSIPLTSSGKVRRNKTKQEFVENELQTVSFWSAE